jgi:hypothetical protein
MLSMKSVDDVWSFLLFKRSVDKSQESLLLRGVWTMLRVFFDRLSGAPFAPWKEC